MNGDLPIFDLERLYDVHWEMAGTLDDPISAIVTEHHRLYQLIGHHSLYGSNSLLYIGMSENVRGRLEKHRQIWASAEANPIEVRVAKSVKRP